VPITVITVLRPRVQCGRSLSRFIRSNHGNLSGGWRATYSFRGRVPVEVTDGGGDTDMGMEMVVARIISLATSASRGIRLLLKVLVEVVADRRIHYRLVEVIGLCMGIMERMRCWIFDEWRDRELNAGRI
jgi:hypothetical protein